ncbi:SpoIIE family protein phosphatase [bacterium]|nr:SpoIIE family protein phosphatase [bacterium]
MARLLIVDDTPENLVLLSATLEDSHEITVATSGREALLAARQMAPVDLILLDVSMPEMDGYEVCAALKEIPTWSKVPVIFVTGLNSSQEEERGLRAGAVDYITKPFHPELLRARVSNHVELKRHRDHLESEVQRRTEELVQATLARRKLQSDLNLALKLQLSLLPPDHYQQPGCTIATVLRPARTIGGDFYDYMRLGPDRLLLAVGDVSDKGVAAALFMVRVVTLLHWLAPSCTDPSQLLSQLNMALCHDNEACMFVTLGLGLADLTRGQVHYASAGHEPPVLLTPSKPAQTLVLAGGPALGLFREAQFPSHCLQLQAGQSLMLLSDGVAEANNHQAEEFGYPRLLAALSKPTPDDPASALRACLQAVEEFTAQAEPSDDLTLLVFQPDPVQEHHWQIPNRLPELRGFQERLRQTLGEAGCSQEAIHDLELATEELLANTISYGYEEGQQALIDVSIWADPQQVKILLSDTGKEFDPLQADERPDDKVGGWGIPLIHHLMDEFHYQRVNNSNQVSLLRRERDSSQL